jgi:ferrochelatase
MNKETGVLLLNIGTPDAPTPEAVREYLAEFLSDPYLIDFPRWFWLPILNKIILRSRPARSAALYASIWQESGSPLLTATQSIAEKIRQANPGWHIAVGMRYGCPSIREGLDQLAAAGVDHLVIFPLFPQYSSTTNLTAIEHTFKQIEAGFNFEEITVIEDYHDHPAYIRALAASIKTEWAVSGQPERLLFSFHGVPRRYVTRKGEPYQDQCCATAALVADQLSLQSDEYIVSFQSRFGPEPWLTPYTDETLEELGAHKLDRLGVVCPGFAADCLETLEEIAIQGREVYEESGGEGFRYIPALNDSELHIQALSAVIADALKHKNG